MTSPFAPLEPQAFKAAGEALAAFIERTHSVHKTWREYSESEILAMMKVCVNGYQNKILTLISPLSEERTQPMISQDPPISLSDSVNALIDQALQEQRTQQAERDYLGASRLGVPCSRALQYEYRHMPRDTPLSGKSLRIFEMGHALEEMALNWLTFAGFEIFTRRPNGEPFGFSVAQGRIRGHVDGIVHTVPAELEMKTPALWECKSMNAKSWKQTVEKGVRVAKPVYGVQIATYQAYMEGTIADISKNPALLTAVNKDTSELYHELVPFDSALAQQASDKGVNILRATDVGETLPRLSRDPEYFECRFCDWKTHCWKEDL
jgi:hypothetical protein